MALNADTLLDRMHLKSQAQRWRIIALAVGLSAILLLLGNIGGVTPGLNNNYIARFTVEDVIVDDVERQTLLRELAEDDNVKAVILRMDSPGGTTVGSDQLYRDIRAIAEHKPVVCTMRSYATSGGYLASLGADYIFANHGTLTGSIGVILQTAEVTKLIEKIGVTPITVKSGPLKGSPTMFEKFTPDQEALLKSIINDFQDYFLGLVKERRKLTDAQLKNIADGRVVSAPTALELHLIDAIGGEDEALKWLEKEHDISADLDVKDVELSEEEPSIKKFVGSYASQALLNHDLTQLDGLISVWQPALFSPR